MKSTHLIAALCVVALGTTTLVKDAQATDPFKCAVGIVRCVSALTKFKELDTAFKGMKSACNELKYCKKKCGLDKKKCKRLYNSIAAVKKTFKRKHWKRICKSTKHPCKAACKVEYLTETCISARSKVNELIMGNEDQTKGIVPVCLNALKACAPFPQVQCAVAVAMCINSKTKSVKNAAKKVQSACQDLKSCKNTCLQQSTGKKVRACKKKCRKSYREGDCKSARKNFVKVIRQEAATCAGTAIKACSHAD